MSKEEIKTSKKGNVKLSILKGKSIKNTYYKKQNLGNLLIEAAKSNNGILFINDDYSEIYLSYNEILEKAYRALGAFEKLGIKKGEYAILIIDENMDFVISFWACILGGIIPVPLTHPTAFTEGNAIVEKIISIWNSLKQPALIVDEKMRENYNLFRDSLKIKEMKILGTQEIAKSNTKGKLNLADVKSPAFIQFSSGSTNSPKGVVLTHENILINVESMVNGAKLCSEDTIVSWMPFSHDMGLIGFHITQIAVVAKIINIPTLTFIKNPILWMDLISKHKATVTCSPNFGYKLLLSRITEKHLNSWDLSSLRLLINGAEPISSTLVNVFLDKLACCGLKRTSMNQAYGMAEASLTITLSPLEKDPLSHCLSRKKMANESKAEINNEKSDNSMFIADLGYVVDGMELRIVDSKGKVVPENTIGEIQIKGRNITPGYLNNPQLNSEVFKDGWFNTGDMGFVVNSRLSITGRMKDIIFVNGQNFYAHDVESRIEALEGVEPGKIAICGWQDEIENREKVVLFSGLFVKPEFYSKIISFVSETIGINIDYIVLVKDIPKTASGKIQRFVLMKAFKNNEYGDSTYSANEFFMSNDTNDNNENKIEVKNTISNKDNYLKEIREAWAKVLELPEETISFDRPFLALGGNSIKAIQLLSYLEEELKITLSHDILIKCSTIGEMNEYLLRISNKKPSKQYDENDKDMKQEEIEHSNNPSTGDIAVISMSCHFPEAKTLEEFWNNLSKGKSSFTEIPSNRWDVSQYYSSSKKQGKTYCNTGAFIDNPYAFDAKFFNITEEEAEVMDPQQRIILELVYETLENADYSKEYVDGKNIGVFVGAGTNNYLEYHLNTLNMNNIKEFSSFNNLSEEQRKSFIEEWKNRLGVTEDHPNLLVDNILNMVAARASHEFNFKGPSLTVDTACSSSLVTIHLACDAIRRNECEMAIAGGINLLLTPTPYIYFSSAGALSQTGQSKVFDSEADGFVPGEGGGLVLLKSMDKALEDGDEILAVIKGSAVNNDGHSIGVMAPNPDGQRSVIEALYSREGIDPKGIQYVEAHGTGTKIGDPSEVRALAQAFNKWKPKNESIAIGSVKANIGHLLNAAGIASFIKVVLALKNKTIPPNVNLSTPNPMIKFPETPFYLTETAKEWKLSKEGKRRAAINSFGFGGTNCHMLIEEAPAIIEPTLERENTLPKQVLCVTAHTQEALKEKISNLSAFLKEHKNYSLGDICYTENSVTTAFKYRSNVVSSSVDELIEKLDKLTLDNTTVENLPKVAMMFTGQGCQYVGMARAIYNAIPEFKEYVDMCSEAFYPYIGEKITDLIYAENAEEKILAQTNITQPVVFTLDYSMGKLLIDWGVKPACVLGHSVGEWAAACVAGVVDLKDAAKIVSARGRLMNDLKIPGAMAAVFTTGDKLEELLKNFNKEVWIAAYNGNHQVISGSTESIDEFIGILEKNGVVCKKLKVSQAFHTPLMEPMLKEFKKELEGIKFKEANMPIVSNITAEFIDKPLDCQYWLDHILSPVKFEQSIKFIKSKGINTFVEAGPDKTLTGMATAVLLGSNANVLSMLNRKKDNWEVLLETIGRLYCIGVKINWASFYKNFICKKVKLPNYPFQRKTYGPKFGDASINYNTPNNWFYKWQWTEEENTEEKNILEGSVVIFNDVEGLGNELAKKFSKDNNPVYFVEPGKEFNYDGESKFTINIHKKEDYNNIFKNLPHKPSLIVHLWNLPYSNFEAEAIVSKDELFDETLYSIFNIGQAVKAELDNNIRFIVVTDRAQFIDEKYTVSGAHQSLATVLAQAIDEENSNFNSNIIDIDSQEYKAPAGLAEKLFYKLNNKFDEEGIVVIRNNKSFVRKLEQLKISEDRLKINAGETYLITGGTSPLGGDIAKELAKQAKVNLVLTGRSVLPEREQWKENFHSDSIKEKINLIFDLEKLGAKVIYASVDVTDKSEMEKLVRKVNDAYGNIHGVIHAAGVMDYSSFKLLNKDTDTLKKVFAPKLQGTIITDLVTRKEPLKFFVMISSVSATKKKWSQGLGEYAAANSFLNAYTHYRKSANALGRTIAVNYSLWDNKGMGSMFGKSAANAIKAQGLNPLAPEKAANAFLKAISVKGESNVHIIDLIEEKVTENIQPIDKVKSAAAEGNRVVSYLEAKEVKNTVYKVIAEQLKIPLDSLDIGMNFLELGMDSVGAMKVIESLSKALDVELYPTIIFEYQTPEALSNYIENSYFTTGELKKEKDIDKAEVDKEIDDIAIIGISLRIPGADSLEEYWNILDKGIVTTREIPEERWSIEDEYNPDKDCLNTSYSKCGGFINKAYDFDPIFFGISPKEAEAMDPQQRIFLEVAWEALQEAGYGGKYKTDKVGVFVGAEQNNYMEHFSNYRSYTILKNRFQKSKWFNNVTSGEKKEIISTLINVLKPAKLKADAVPGNGLNEIAARVSHCLNLMGPSLVVNTACSSSLVALHMACENIRTKQSDMAIVGGVNLNLSSIPFISMSKLNAISPTGECRPFDKDADGMILSEGVSAIVIKPLKKALKDGDNIYATIKGSAINNDGHSQGITAPRPQGQAIAVENAYRNAKVNPETISYIETHGTGTPLGDPIEVEGMTKAFRAFTDKNGFCAIGSVKSSIGHMLAASGLVSLIKIVLAMKHKKIPHTVNYETPNTNINFKNTPFFVVERESIDWKSDGENPLRAGVNAFGFGGTNAHVVLEEAPLNTYKNDENKSTNEYLLQLAGRNEAVIKNIAKRLQNHIEKNPQIDLSSLCVTMNNSQKQLAYKNALVVDSKKNLLNLLGVIQKGTEEEGLYKGKSNPNRDTTCHLLLDGNILIDESEIKKLRNRFEVFHKYYTECEKELENIKTIKEINEELKEKIKIFSVEYALGCVFADLEIKFESIIAKDTGILSSAVLIGELSIREALTIILDEINYENQLNNDNSNIHFRCPVVTSIGILNNHDKDKFAFIKKALSTNKLSDELKNIVKKNEVMMYLGTSKLIRKEISELNIEEIFLQGNITTYHEKEILILLAKLYTFGVAYNPRNIYPKEVLKTPLPTYPFENSTYKVSFEEDLDQYGKNDVMISKTIITEADLENTIGVNDNFRVESVDSLNLVRITTSACLSRNEKQASYDKLSFDFNLEK